MLACSDAGRFAARIRSRRALTCRNVRGRLRERKSAGLKVRAPGYRAWEVSVQFINCPLSFDERCGNLGIGHFRPFIELLHGDEIGFHKLFEDHLELFRTQIVLAHHRAVVHSGANVLDKLFRVDLSLGHVLSLQVTGRPPRPAYFSDTGSIAPNAHTRGSFRGIQRFVRTYGGPSHTRGALV